MPQLISLFDVHTVASSLANKELWLTPNQRLASRISNAYSIYCKQHGHSVVAAPNVQSYNQWVDARWRDLVMMAYPDAIQSRLLSLDEQCVILEKIITDSDEGQMLLRPSATARQVASAIETHEQWCLDIGDNQIQSEFYHEDSRCFLKWYNSYKLYCEEHKLTPPVYKANIVSRAYNEGVFTKLKSVTLSAFEALYPQQKQLLNIAFETVKPMDVDYKKAASQCAVACDNFEHEFLIAALWAKQQFKDAVDSNNLPTIAVVVPQLNQYKTVVKRIFEEVFVPENISLGARHSSLPFNISAGGPLADEPVIAAALKLLELSFTEVDSDDLIALLQSPFVGACNDDMSLVAQLIVLIKKQKSQTIKLSALRRLSQKVSDKSGDEQFEWQFAQCLTDYSVAMKRVKINRPGDVEHWRNYILEVLEIMSWPGNRNPDSHEYQALQQFKLVLDDFSQSVVIGSTTFANALVYFKQLLASAVFQPQSKESPLQILGVLEASGLHFDKIWLTGMSAKEWPVSPKPNPLLPFGLQQQHEMPHATADRELQLAQHISKRFIANTTAFYVSYSKVIDDNPSSISALFESIKEIDPDQLLMRTAESLSPKSEIYRRYQESQQLEEYSYDNAPELSAEESVKGGVSLFANQSACPFKAFATHRLGLKSFELPVIGLDKSVKGNLLHRALELIWKQLVDSQALLSLSDLEQNKLCKDYADYVLNEYNQKIPEPIGLRHHKIEAQRLTQLLVAWLNVEKERASFTVVSTEETKTFRYAQLELVGRVDRVDQIGDGSHIVVDYKTGKPNVNAWWGERPEQPQLPLYGELLESEGRKVSAVAFAQVNAEATKLKGVGETDHTEPGLAWNSRLQSQSGVPSWQELKNHWHKVLTSLANDFISGKSNVDPLNPVKSCQYCDLSSVCRIGHTVVEGQI